MAWNWEKPGWPKFSWDASLIRKAEERFLVGTTADGGVVGATVVRMLGVDTPTPTVAHSAADGGGGAGDAGATCSTPGRNTSRNAGDVVADATYFRALPSR